ncbi:family 43 glycosylhydrolase [Actinokineospora sp. HUAS TT18]|uniref:family 43 glycosylhydrolase n=1 Tax=Actinokineospora sp. HUAS TT18 TaxID=3447451 RepID=UPI003F522C79
MKGLRRVAALGAVVAACAGGLFAAVPGATAGAAETGARDESLDFRFPAADLIRVPDTNTYVAFGASIAGNKLPYTKVEFADGAFQRRSAIDGDAWDDVTFPADYWARPNSPLWTPAVLARQENDRTVYYLFYSAALPGPEPAGKAKHCIGYATSLRYTGGFVANAAPLFCPERGWAIDADVSRGQDGVWLTLRNGAWTQDRVTALGAAKLEFDRPRHIRRLSEGDPQKLIDNADLEWTHHNSPSDDVLTIENPNAVRIDGEWYLFYSGNNWYANRYATGVAYCGTALSDNRCTPMYEQRAYFSYKPDPDGEPRFRPGLPDRYRKNNLPGNKRGPGAFNAFQAPDGSWWASWNYITDASPSLGEDPSPDRRSRIARLTKTGSGPTAEFTASW